MDDNGDVIGKLTEGEVSKCAGKEIDNDGDIINEKGQTLGHVTLINDIPEPVAEEPKESEEEIEEKKRVAQDKKLASAISGTIQDTIERMKPILSDITSVSESDSDRMKRFNVV